MFIFGVIFFFVSSVVFACWGREKNADEYSRDKKKQEMMYGYL